MTTTPPPDPRPRRATTTDPVRPDGPLPHPPRVERKPTLGERSGSHRAATRAPTVRAPTTQAPPAPPRPARRALQAVRRFLHGAFFDNGSIKLVALVLAITIFILVNTEKDAVIGVDVGVSYSMPEDRVLVSEPVDRVHITVRGSRRQLRRFDARELERIHIPLNNMKSGEFVFQEDMVRLPPGLELVSINPATMHLLFEKRVAKSVPVAVKTAGAPVVGYQVERKVANPSHVTIRGAESVVAAVSEVRTAEVSLVDRRASFRERVSLVAPEQYVEIVDDSQVEVDISLVEQLEQREVGPLPVAVVAGAGSAAAVAGWRTEPGEVMVVLHGSRVAVDQAVARGIRPYVKVFPADLGARSRSFEVLVDIEGVGPEIKPREVELRPR